MKEKKTEGNWQFDFEYASSIAILRAEAIEPTGQHEDLCPLDLLVISEHSKPYKLRFAFEANEGKSPIFSSKGWNIPLQIKLGRSNPTTLNMVADFVLPINERNKNIREVRKSDQGKLKKALLKADYMEVSWEQMGNPVAVKFNPAGSKKAIKAIVSKSRRAYVSNLLSSVWIRLRKSTAEKVLNKYKMKYKDKKTHLNGVMANGLREMVIKHGGLKGVRYWEFEDYSCIYDIEKGRRNYLGEKISPLWYDHRSRPYGTGERRPNMDGLRFYIPISELDHRAAIAKSATEGLRKSEALAKELEERLQKEFANLKAEFGKIKNAKPFKWISCILTIWRIITAPQEIISIIQNIISIFHELKENAEVIERLENVKEFIKIGWERITSAK